MDEFVEIRFPEDISYGMSGGPEYFTEIVELKNGFEQRNINWPKARNRYNAAHGVRNKQQFEQLLSFFRARKGRAIGFRFKDWLDYQVINQDIYIGDNSKIFQLVKNYRSGNSLETRIITKPVIGTVFIYLNYKLYDQIEIDYKTGIVRCAEPIPTGSIISASFEFDVPVRFDIDKLSATIDDYGTYSWQDIPLIEIFI